MKLFKVDVWVKENNFKTYLVVSDCKKNAISKILNKCEIEELIGITAKLIENIDQYKISINEEC